MGGGRAITHNLVLKHYDMDVQFEFDNDSLMEHIISPVMNAPDGTLAHAVRDDWAEIAVIINSNKLYDTPDGDVDED